MVKYKHCKHTCEMRRESNESTFAFISTDEQWQRVQRRGLG